MNTPFSNYPHQNPKDKHKTLMKSIHQKGIKYLTYLGFNKRKLKNKQPTITPPKIIVFKSNP